MFKSTYTSVFVLIFVLSTCSRMNQKLITDNKIEIKLNPIDQRKKSDTELITNKFQQYLSNLGNVFGDFVQESSNGEKQIGKFYISIPGKMKIDYNNGVVIIADGNNFIYYDSSNDQITVLNLKSSPAGILLSNVKFDNVGAKIVSIDRKKDITHLHTIVKNSMFNTQIIFKVIENPFKLLGWIVQDIQGITTDFSIVDLHHFVGEFDKNLFILKRKGSYTPGSIRVSDDY